MYKEDLTIDHKYVYKDAKIIVKYTYNRDENGVYHYQNKYIYDETGKNHIAWYEYKDGKCILINKIPKHKIEIDTSKLTLTLYKYGEVFKTYPVAVGKPSSPTPKGTFKIVNKHPNMWGPYGAKWMGLSKPRYGIHGTDNPSSIGTRASAGCIRMYNKDVIELYGIVDIGTIVKIY